jgi:hypothetical protein
MQQGRFVSIRRCSRQPWEIRVVHFWRASLGQFWRALKCCGPYDRMAVWPLRSAASLTPYRTNSKRSSARVGSPTSASSAATAERVPQAGSDADRRGLRRVLGLLSQKREDGGSARLTRHDVTDGAPVARFLDSVASASGVRRCCLHQFLNIGSSSIDSRAGTLRPATSRGVNGGRTWWALFKFTRINTAPTFLCKKIEDAREVGATLAFVESNVAFNMTVKALTRLRSPSPGSRFLAKSSRFFAA